MIVDIAITLNELRDEDFKNLDDSENHIISTALEAAGHAILALEERRWQRFIRYCHTGKFK